MQRTHEEQSHGEIDGMFVVPQQPEKPIFKSIYSTRSSNILGSENNKFVKLGRVG